MYTIDERKDAIIRGIMSGDNACGALKHAIDTGKGPEFLACKVVPTLRVYEEEAAQLRQDKAELSQREDDYRRALEYIYGNAHGMSPDQIQVVAHQALGLAKGGT